MWNVQQVVRAFSLPCGIYRVFKCVGDSSFKCDDVHLSRQVE